MNAIREIHGMAARIFFQTYRFAEFCRTILPGYHQAELLSDLPISDGGSTEAAHLNALRYFLYPIDISGVSKRAGVRDSYILWFKTDLSGLPNPNSIERIVTFENQAVVIIK